MTLRQIALGCTLALGAVSSPAWAVSPAACAGSAFDIDIYLTGASAPQNSLGGIAAEIFAAGFTVVFDNGTSGSKGASYRAYCGTLNNTVGATLAGKKVRLLNRARGGSVWGVNPVARDQAIATLGFDPATCAASAIAGVNFECPEVGDDFNPNVANRKPDFGVSDVEPAMFKAPYNVEFGQTQLTAAELTKFSGTIKPGYQVIFGPALTNNVGLADLSRSQVIALLTGQYQTWDQAGSALTGPVTVCRRVQGSGTQASFNQYFGNFPCAVGDIAQSGNLPPTRMADSAGYDGAHAGTPGDPILVDPSAGPTTVENPASGDVRTCLISAQNGIDYTFKGDDGRTYKIEFSNAGGPYGAIGVLSLDSKGASGFGVSPTGQWQFARLNGIDPTVQTNAQTGLYDFVLENTFQRKNDKTYPSGLYVPFINLFIAKAESQAILAAIANVNVRQSLLAVPNIAGNPTPIVGTNITSKWTRNQNSCSPAQLAF